MGISHVSTSLNTFYDICSMKLVIIMCTGFAMIDYLVSDSSDTERFNTGTPAVTVSLHRGVRRAVGFEMGTTKDHLSGR